jgi:hypothetical protein
MLSALQDSVESIKKGLAQYGANLTSAQRLSHRHLLIRPLNSDVSHSALESASHTINEANTISSLKSTAPLYEQVQEELEESKPYSTPFIDPSYPGEPCKRILFGLDLDEQAEMSADLEDGIPMILNYLMDDIARRGVDEPDIYVRGFVLLCGAA